MDAFDADVLIYAAQKDPRGDVVASLLVDSASANPSIGSTLLIPELLSHPIRRGDVAEQGTLEVLLSRIQLKSVDRDIALLAAWMRAKYRLHTPDAVHLATAVVWGAERFYTNNRKDFGPHIEEIEVVLP